MSSTFRRMARTTKRSLSHDARKPSAKAPARGLEALEERCLLSGVSFGPSPISYPDLGAQAVTLADFNRDGILDMAVPTSGNTVGVFLGDGMGGFGARTDFTSGYRSNSVAAADFNGDGKMDMAVANYGTYPDIPGTIAVFLGDGNGGFSPKTDLATGSASSVVAADFNGDGKMDLGEALSGGSTFSVLLGDGMGGFGPKTDFTTGTDPHSVVVADFNGDGKLDLATANAGPLGSVSVLLGDGNGGFGTKTDFAAGPHPQSLTAADFNGDGKLDLAEANGGVYPNYNGSVSVLLGDGMGGFGPKTSFVTGVNSIFVTAADFNGDGKLDLAVANQGQGTSTSSVSVLPGDGLGGFGPRADYATGSSPVSLAAADFNGDGRMDLAAINGNNVSILLGNGLGGLVSRDFATCTYPQSFSHSVTAADFNNDGKLDLAVADAADSGSALHASASVRILLGNGIGGYSVKGDFVTGAGPTSVTAADFNGDGKLDLATANSYAATVSVLLGDGMGGFSAKTDLGMGGLTDSITCGDFNGDGKLDLAAAIKDGNTVSVLLGDGKGGFGSKTQFATGSYPESVTAADFNGDGKLDLAVANSSSNTISVLLGDGRGGFGAKTDFPTGMAPRSVTAADVNGDGMIDLAVANSSSNTLSVLLGDGMGGFGAKMDYATGLVPYSVTAADFNGDGKIDLATPNFDDSTVSVLLGDGLGGFGAKADFATGYEPLCVTAADLNSDGRMDLATANYFGGSVTVLLNTTGNPPIASAGRPYVIGQGLPLTLNASASSDPQNDPLSYAWDINGDGDFTDAVGVNPTISWAQLQALGLDAPGVYDHVQVRVDDGQGNVVTSAATQLKILWTGDANGDGKVRFADYLVLEQNFGKSGQTWATGDFTGDGKVSFADYLLLEQNFGKSLLTRIQPPAPVETALAVPAKLMAAQAPAQMASSEVLRAVPTQSLALTGWKAQAARAVRPLAYHAAAGMPRLHRLGDVSGLIDLLALHHVV